MIEMMRHKITTPTKIELPHLRRSSDLFSKQHARPNPYVADPKHVFQNDRSMRAPWEESDPMDLLASEIQNSRFRIFPPNHIKIDILMETPRFNSLIIIVTFIFEKLQTAGLVLPKIR